MFYFPFIHFLFHYITFLICRNFFAIHMQFPIECSLPWMLVDHVLESQNAGLLESVLMPFDIYNDSAQQALAALRQRFLYDEIEAEVYYILAFSRTNFFASLVGNVCIFYLSFDKLAVACWIFALTQWLQVFIGGPLFWFICFKTLWNYFHLLQELGSKVHGFPSLINNTCYWKYNVLNHLSCWFAKSCSEMLDPSFLFALDNGEKYSVQPMRFTALFKMTRVKVKV